MEASGGAIARRGLVAWPVAAQCSGGLSCSEIVRLGHFAPGDGTDGRNLDAIPTTGPLGISAAAPNQDPTPQVHADVPTLAPQGRPPSSDPKLNGDDLHCSRY